MSSLFSEHGINTMSVKNRFVRSATWEGRADWSILAAGRRQDSHHHFNGRSI